MRIVHVANFVGPRSGGVRTTMLQLGAGYERFGHEFTMIIPGRRFSRSNGESGTVITLPSLPLLGTGYRVMSEFQVRRALSRLAPDRIEVSDRLTLRRLGTWAQSRGIPAVMFSHEKLTEWLDQLVAGFGLTPDSAVRARGARWLADRLNSASLRNFDRVICTTAFAAEEFERLRPGAVSRVSLGVDLELFSPQRWDAELRRELADDAEFVLMHSGRLSREKAPQLSVEAIRVLCVRGVNVRLVIAGDGPLRRRLTRVAAGLPVSFLGHVQEREALAAMLASADVSLNPGPIETFCLAALEALASGTPIVGVSGSALTELLGPAAAAGEIVSGTPEAFADAVERLLAQPVENRRGAARARAAEFSWSRTVAAMLELHAQLGVTASDRPTPSDATPS